MTDHGPTTHQPAGEAGTVRAPQPLGSLGAAAGLSFFAVSVYVVVLAPELLASMDIPREAAMMGCCLSVGAATILSAKLTGTPLVVGPAVGVLAFARNYQHLFRDEITGYEVLLASAVGGAVALAVACLGHRRTIIEQIPQSIRLGINGSVGAMLAGTAFTLIAPPARTPTIPLVAGTSVTAATLVALYLLRGQLETRIQRGSPSSTIARAGIQICNAYFFAAIALGLGTFCFAVWIIPNETVSWNPSVQLFVVKGLLGAVPNIGTRDVFTLLPFVLVVIFVLLTDIPGTPFQLMPDDGPRSSTKDHAVDRSFIADGLAAIFYPALAMTTPIYYSENNVVRELEDRAVSEGKNVWAPGPAYWAGGVYFGLAALVWLTTTLWGAVPVLPALIAAPALLLLAGVIVADGIRASVEDARASASRNFHFYLPAAAGILLTPRYGLAVGLAAACAAFTMVKVGRRTDETAEGSFIVVAGLTIVAAVLQVLARSAQAG